MTASVDPTGRRAALVLLFVFYAVAGVLHFVAVDLFATIVPPWVPDPRTVVQATGVAELSGAAGLIHPATRLYAGWGLAAYALCVWPANFHHAAIDLGSGTGLPALYHYPRLAFQPLLIWWALWASGAVRVSRR